MLHSEVVSGWPGLEVEGYSEIVKNAEFAGSNKKLTILRKERLSDSILLCLFQREVKTVDLSLKGSSVNCGVDPFKKGDQITKGLRGLDGTQITPERKINVPLRNAELGVIDIKEMAKKLQQGLSCPEKFTSAQFAATTIEGSPKVRFCSKSI